MPSPLSVAAFPPEIIGEIFDDTSFYLPKTLGLNSTVCSHFPQALVIPRHPPNQSRSIHERQFPAGGLQIPVKNRGTTSKGIFSIRADVDEISHCMERTDLEEYAPGRVKDTEKKNKDTYNFVGCWLQSSRYSLRAVLVKISGRWFNNRSDQLGNGNDGKAGRWNSAWQMEGVVMRKDLGKKECVYGSSVAVIAVSMNPEFSIAA
ncbi:hypothetical protein B0H13DRAFT_1917883 [Mycena leptocephala]|nr:hypothetical protein B0H13DRAFT_1917883 [Mycena leptocephala]